MDNIIELDSYRSGEPTYETVDAVTSSSKQWSAVNDSSSDGGSGLWNEEVRAWMDLNTLKGLFFSEGWVYILVDRGASKISAQQLRVMKSTIVDGEERSEAAQGHSVQKRLEKPNKTQTYYQWIYSVIADLRLTGNAIVYKSPATGELMHIPIEMVALDFNTDGSLKCYRIIQYSTNYEMPIAREIMRLDPKDVAHIRKPNPSSAMWGLSPYVPARKSILFDRYSLEFLNNFYIKGATPGLILTLDSEANEASALRLLRSMESAYTGRRNQRRNMVLPKGVTADTKTQTLADQQLEKYVDQNREVLINVSQVPKHELSLADSGSLGSEEYKTALRNFWSGPLKSEMSSIEESLTELMADDLGDQFYLEFDVSDVEFMQDDLNAKADLAIKMLNTHTLNEVRAKVFKDKPLEGGDVTPSKTPAPQGYPQYSLPSASQEKGDDIPTTTTEEIKVEEPEIDERRLMLDSNLKVLDTMKASNPAWWKQREAKLGQDETRRYALMHKKVLDLFAEQVVSAVRTLKANAGGSLKSLKAEQYPRSKIRRNIRDGLNNFEATWIEDTIKVLRSSLNIGYDTQLILPFNIPDRSAIESLRAMNEAKLNDMLEGRIGEVFSGINATTTDKIMRIIDEGVENGRTLNEISDNIVRDIANPQIANSRAQTITRTEILTATSLGQAAAMQDAATVIPDLKKMWINAGDDRVRGNPAGLYPKSTADHWHIGGEMVAHDKSFSNGLQFPRDPSGDGGEVINCRCTFIMVPGQDADALGIQRVQEEQQNPSPGG